MKRQSQNIIHEDIRQDPGIKRLLERMPDSVGEKLDDEQLTHIRNAIGARKWGKHGIDRRGTLTFPFVGWRYYYVFIIGKNRRQLSSQEKRVAALIGTIFVFGLITFAILFALLVLYLLKSAAGIDLFPGFSLGIWTWFKINILPNALL